VKTSLSAKLVPDPEAGERRVIGRLVGRDHPERHVLATAALDRPRRALADRVRVEQQRDHHRRIKRRATPTVLTVPSQERREIKLVDGIEHEPRQVIGRQPITQARRQQQLLLAITPQEVLRHPHIVLTGSDISTGKAPGLRDSLKAPGLRDSLAQGSTFDRP
jgi:hypothetical protein